MGCGASAEKKAEEPPATDSSAAPAAASAASPAAEAAESKAEEPKAELTSTTDGKEVPMEQKVQLAAAPQAESSAPANPCTAAPEMLEAMQKLVDATAQEQKGLKVQEVLKVQNAQMQHRYDHFAADLHRNFGSSIARHVVLTDDLGPAELRKEINEMYLFHGTSPTEAKQIASSDFDFKEEAGHVRTTFGLGLHLPEAAGRAHENSKVEDSLRALLLVKAVGGNVHTAVEHGDSSEMVHSGQYDSVCGIHPTHREMVFYHHKSVCCDYIILYKQAEAAPTAEAAAPAAAPAAEEAAPAAEEAAPAAEEAAPAAEEAAPAAEEAAPAAEAAE